MEKNIFTIEMAGEAEVDSSGEILVFRSQKQAENHILKNMDAEGPEIKVIPMRNTEGFEVAGEGEVVEVEGIETRKYEIDTPSGLLTVHFAGTQQATQEELAAAARPRLVDTRGITRRDKQS